MLDVLCHLVKGFFSGSQSMFHFTKPGWDIDLTEPVP